MTFIRKHSFSYTVMIIETKTTFSRRSSKLDITLSKVKLLIGYLATVTGTMYTFPEKTLSMVIIEGR